MAVYVQSHVYTGVSELLRNDLRAVLGVRFFREHDCDPGEVCQIEIEVRKSIKHLRRVREWLQGASKNPKEAVLKGRLRELL